MDILTICNNCVDNYNNTVYSELHVLTPKQITPETQNSFIVQLRGVYFYLYKIFGMFYS
jgi:hypothetical protein